MSELAQKKMRRRRVQPSSVPSSVSSGLFAFVFVHAFAPSPARAEDTRATQAPEQAEEVTVPTSAPASDERDREKYRRQLRELTHRGAYFDLFATLMFGDGIRFNNPYRLSHQLGTTGESLSLTAPYLDVAIVVATGNARGLSHGGRLSWSSATSGVVQNVITPAYAAVLRPGGPWLLYGWLGMPVVMGPDFLVGGELALGATYFVRAGLGATCALVGDGFYGAATRETRAAFYPILSGQVGISVNYEVLP